MLPFSSLDEAAASLGRPLSHAEILWFRYTATASDHVIYGCIFILIFLGMFLYSIPYTLLEAMIPKRMHKYKIQPRVKIPFSQVLQCHKEVFKFQLFSLTPFQIMFIPYFKFLGIRTGLPLPSLWPEVALQILVYLLVEDYLVYWIHRLMHRPWLYEKLHRFHHEYTTPISICTNYGHPGDILFSSMATIVGPAIAPCHAVTFTLWLVLRQIEAVDTHCGYDFPWGFNKFIPFFGGAEYHDYHHHVGKSCESNFASTFTYCDYIYGTDKGYRFRKACLAKIKRNLPKEEKLNIFQESFQRLKSQWRVVQEYSKVASTKAFALFNKE